jgi:hypothetical protein
MYLRMAFMTLIALFAAAMPLRAQNVHLWADGGKNQCSGEVGSNMWTVQNNNPRAVVAVLNRTFTEGINTTRDTVTVTLGPNGGVNYLGCSRWHNGAGNQSFSVNSVKWQ